MCVLGILLLTKLSKALLTPNMYNYCISLSYRAAIYLAYIGPIEDYGYVQCIHQKNFLVYTRNEDHQFLNKTFI